MKYQSLIAIYFLSVCFLQIESFTILKKIKDYFHPTTTTTTAAPITDYERDNEPRTEYSSILSTSTSSSWTEDNNIPAFTTSKDHYSDKGENNHTELPTARSLYNFEDEESREKPSSPENFPTISPPDVYEVYPGMKKNPSTTQVTTYDDFYSQKNSSHQRPFEEVSNQEIKTTTENNYYNQIQPDNSNKNEIPGLKIQTTTYRIKNVNDDDNVQPYPRETTTISYNNKIQTTYRSLNNNNINDESFQEKTTTTSYNNEIPTTTFRSGNSNSNNIQPYQGETSTTSYNNNNNVMAVEKPKPGSSYSNKNETTEEESLIVFPDNPCLNIVDQSVVGGPAVTDCRFSPTTTIGPSQGVQKVPVPVGDDGGRNIANGATKDCGQGKKLDDKGRCRSMARK